MPLPSSRASRQSRCPVIACDIDCLATDCDTKSYRTATVPKQFPYTSSQRKQVSPGVWGSSLARACIAANRESILGLFHSSNPCSASVRRWPALLKSSLIGNGTVFHPQRSEVVEDRERRFASLSVTDPSDSHRGAHPFALILSARYILCGQDLRNWNAIGATGPPVGRAQRTQFWAGQGIF